MSKNRVTVDFFFRFMKQNTFFRRYTNNTIYKLLRREKKRMTTDTLNNSLIEAMKLKIPDGVNLANILMDVLYIGKEAVYRRLRGEVPFTLAEAAVLSKKLGISLDKIIGTSSSNSAMFDLNFLHYSEPLKTYAFMIGQYAEVLEKMSKEPDSQLCTASNMIPQAFYLRYNYLSRFRLFKWMYQHEKVDCVRKFSELQPTEELVRAQMAFVDASQHIHTTHYIWDSMIITHLINDIKYFQEIQLVTEEEVEKLKEELLLLIDELEEIATNGMFPATRKSVNIFISNIDFEATYSYAGTKNLEVSMIRIFSINSITSLDKQFCQSLKDWIKSLKRFSTHISVSGEIQRIQFFNTQREYVRNFQASSREE